ncbi:hypothetical protein [Streptomyces sp. NPDC001422]|uniref:hypothetical protein n=1 Tax=Streptomyces sp. NPDC001422 TaxID=3364575 RepID=UPI0036A0C48F
MAVSLTKPYALEVATIGAAWDATTHGIRGFWKYTGENRTTCGKRPNSRLTRLNHTSNDHTIRITCGSCLK